MSTYHFIASAEDLQVERRAPSKRRVTVYCRDSYRDPHLGSFERFDFIVNGFRKMCWKNCEGSMILIDEGKSIKRNPINKVHFGELHLGCPHAESYEEKDTQTVRVDLTDWDAYYAKRFLHELATWRNPSYRKSLRERYEAQPQWYGVPYRLKQLRITPTGLEEQINSMQERLTKLEQFERDHPQERRIYAEISTLEQECYRLAGIQGCMAKAIQLFSLTGNEKKNFPKVIVNEEVCEATESISIRLRDMLNDLTERMTDEDIARARNYWSEIASWGSR